jgi:hypothetical protein
MSCGNQCAEGGYAETQGAPHEVLSDDTVRAKPVVADLTTFDDVTPEDQKAPRA